MYIKKLILKNVQKHSLLEVNFQQGISIIYGHTDAGKSSIVRAIRWAIFDDFSSDAIRKLKTKETSVKVILDDDTEVTRIKSNSVNAYELLIPGQELKRFDSIGKGIPEEILKVFGMEILEIDGVKINLNIAEQLAAPFLIGKEYPSTFRAKLFNQLTGNDIQDKIFKDLNKDILGFGRELSNIEKLIVDYQTELKGLEEEKVKAEELYESLNNLLMFLEDLNQTKEKYTELNKKFKNLIASENEAILAINSIKLVPNDAINSIKDKLALFTALKPLQDRARSNRTEKVDAEAVLKKIIVPAFDGAVIQAKIERLLTLKDLAFKKCINSDSGSQTLIQIGLIKTPDLQLEEKYVILNRIEKLKTLLACLQSNDDNVNRVKASLLSLDVKDVSDVEKLNELKKSLPICKECGRLLENCNENK